MESPGWVDTVRYVIGVLYVISLPPAIGYWFLVHPFVAFWRRLGPARSFAALAVLYLGAVAALFPLRGLLLSRDLGFRVPLTLLAVPLVALAVAVAVKRKRLLGFKILVGLPELSPEKHGIELLQEGIYGRVRHPRYLEFMIGGVGWALFINYLGVYLLVALALLLIPLVARVEERELRQRFGAAYDEYAARVPRFIPRWR